MPFEVASFYIGEYYSEDSSKVAKEENLNIASEYILKGGKIMATIHFDKETNQTGKIEIRDSDGNFETMEFQEEVVFYGSTLTHSCIYLFNPIANRSNVEMGHKFMGVTLLTTHDYN